MLTTWPCRFLLLALVAVGTPACGFTGSKFVTAKELTGYSTVRGRILSVRGLSTSAIVPLADGIGVTITEGQCQVMLRFADQRTRAYDVGTGVILVFGKEADALLQPQAPVTPVVQPPSGVPLR